LDRLITGVSEGYDVAPSDSLAVSRYDLADIRDLPGDDSRGPAGSPALWPSGTAGDEKYGHGQCERAALTDPRARRPGESAHETLQGSRSGTERIDRWPQVMRPRPSQVNRVMGSLHSDRWIRVPRSRSA